MPYSLPSKARTRCLVPLCGVLALLALRAPGVHAAEQAPAKPNVAAAIAVVRAVGPNGEGSADARSACRKLSEHGLEILLDLLRGMDTENTVAANWLRLVYEPLVERSLSDKNAVWPIDELKSFVDDARRQTRVRRLVLSLLEQLQPGFEKTWIPTRMSDAGFRYEAIAAVMERAESSLREKRVDEARMDFQAAFQEARDSAQVTQLARKLEAIGQPVDVRKHLGLIAEWWLLGPFDAPGKTGFQKSFPPENRVARDATYPGQNGVELKWTPHATKDLLGTTNLIEALTNCREAVGYAWTEIELNAAQTGQVRCGADDNCTVWINGRRVFGREQWLNGTRFDRFTAPIELPAGRSAILVKVCQGPQHRDPEVPNNWTFQLRLCDSDGRGLPFRVVPLPKASE